MAPSLDFCLVNTSITKRVNHILEGFLESVIYLYSSMSWCTTRPIFWAPFKSSSKCNTVFHRIKLVVACLGFFTCSKPPTGTFELLEYVYKTLQNLGQDIELLLPKTYKQYHYASENRIFKGVLTLCLTKLGIMLK